MDPLDNPEKTIDKILIVDDVTDNLHLLSSTLLEQGYDVRCARSGKMALMGVSYQRPDLILLDIKMPGMSGYEVCRELKLNPLYQDIPIIFLSASNEVDEKIKAFEMGGADYIIKPFEVSEVVARVKNQIRFLEAKHKIESLNTELELRVQERTIELQQVNKALELENQERRRIEDKLIYDAMHDALTGLPNRLLFMNRVEKRLQLLKRYQSPNFALLFLDLDRFKLINDSLGHTVGDNLLIHFAQLLQRSIRESDTVARLGGDEFTILLEYIEDQNEAIAVAERIQEEVKNTLPLVDLNFCTSTSIGIVLGNQRYENTIDLLRDADLAMYGAKEAGKARYAIYNSHLHKKALRRLEMEKGLRQALQNQELSLHYQPIISLETQKTIGFESLIRWQNPQYGMISAGEFIPIAEESGLIIPIGEWVLQESCRQLKEWQETIPGAQDLSISVNLSSKQFYYKSLLATIDQILETTKLPPTSLRLEITETILLESTEMVIQILHAIHQRGIKISLDDFGTGYSSLNYLLRFPIDTIKVDRSFISHLQEDSNHYEIVRAIVTLGHALGKSLVAEGIEMQEQCCKLQELNYDYGQGYLFSRPLTPEAAKNWLIPADQLVHR